ncbi:MAG: phospholipase D-like domain-containing protein [Planctomycetaceae bacterium]
MNSSDLDELLKQTLSDGKVSRAEKTILRGILTNAADTARKRDLLRHQVFDVARESLLGPDAKKVVDWLEDVTGILLQAERPAIESGQRFSEVHFSPGNDCRLRIQQLLRESKARVDICVFTLTDDRIADAVIAAEQRGVKVRLVSDNDKSLDLGSDLQRLHAAGISVRMDNTPYHMHHKFAVFDRSIVVSGSYNWTRSAAEDNEENILVTNDHDVVKAFQKQFEDLWPQMTPFDR